MAAETPRTRPDASAGQREADLPARAAWLHFVGGLTQGEVARRLGVSTSRAHRYIARAQDEGRVHVFVDVEAGDCVVLETRLMQAFGLSYCRVAMDAPESGALPLRALGALGGDFLMKTVAGGAHAVIGLGNGRSIAASVDAMGRIRADHLRFVSMLGGLTRSFAANPYDVIHGMAQKTSAEAYLLPAPLFVNSAEDKRVMMAQTGIAAAMNLIRDASLVVVGIGALDPAASCAPATALESPAEAEALHAAGARAEVLGQFIDADGALMPTPYDARVMAPGLETLRGREMVAVAGGAAKTEAILATLKSGLLTGLIIDEATARSLVEAVEASPPIAAQ